MNTPTKRCRDCGNEFPYSEFYKNKLFKDGMYPRCKACHYLEVRRNIKAKPALYREIAKRAARRYRERHPERGRERTRQYLRKRYRENPERYKKESGDYQRSHPEQSRTRMARRKSRKRNLPATFTTADWQRALDYFEGCCAVCGRPQGFWHTLAQDHWIPLSKGGGYTPDNIIPLCNGDNGCNQSKSNRDATEWLIERVGKRNAKVILERIQDYFHWAKERSNHG